MINCVSFIIMPRLQLWEGIQMREEKTMWSVFTIDVWGLLLSSKTMTGSIAMEFHEIKILMDPH